MKRRIFLKSALLSTLLCSCLLGFLDCTENQPITVQSGETVTLQCNGTRGAEVVILSWRKPGMQSELKNGEKEQLYVLFFRENRSYEKYQLPSFKGRVKLRDPQMKDGDLSVIISNVSVNDTGIYECYARYGRQDPQLKSNITLTVEEPGPSGGLTEDGREKSYSVGLIVGLSVLAVFVVVVVVVVVCFLIYNKRLNQSRTDDQPPPDENIEMLPAAS